MSHIRDPEMYSAITNNCKRPKNFELPETEQFFRIVWFKKFPQVCYSR